MSRWKERKVEEDVALNQRGEDFEHARPLWNAEVTFILQNHLNAEQGNQSINSAQRKVLTDTLNYAASLNNYPSPDAVNAAHELVEKYRLSDWEMAVINNCKIDDADECLSLVPSLKAKVDSGEMDRDKVEEMLNELKRFQTQ